MSNTKTFYNILKESARLYPDNVAIVYDTINVTYSKLFTDAWRKAVHLQKFEGARIAVYGPASYRWIVNVLGVILSGKDVVLVDFFLPQDIRNIMLKKTRVDYTLSSTNQYILSDKNALIIPNADKDDIGDKQYDESVCEGNIIMFTATSEENDKEVVITTSNIISAVEHIDAKLHCCIEDKILSQVSLFDTFGLIYSVIWPLCKGACVCLGRGLRHIDADTYYYNPTILPVTPSMADYLRKVKGFNDNLRTVIVGGAECSERLMRTLSTRSFDTYVVYGDMMNCDCVGFVKLDSKALTAVTSTQATASVAPTTVTPYISYTLYNPDCVHISETGEIIVDGEYVARGGTHTGGYGHLNTDGTLTVTHRADGIIELPTGESLSRQVLIQEITSLTGVAESYVTFYDDKLTTLIVPLNKEESEDKFKRRIDKFNEGKGYRYEIQKVVVVREPLPKTSVGNVDVKVLEDTYLKADIS